MNIITLDGYDLVLDEPNKIDDYDDKLMRSFNILDKSVGNIFWDTKSDSPRIQRQYGWVLEGRSEIKSFKDWLDTHKGRLIPFWLSTWRKDFTMAEDINDESLNYKQMIVKGGNYSRLYKSHAARKRLIFFKRDKTYLIRKIIGSALQLGGKTDLIQLDQLFDAKYTSDDFRLISYLVLVRLDTDDIEIFWETSRLATVKVSIVEVPQEVPTI